MQLTSVLAAQACARTPEQQQLCEQYAAQQAQQLQQLQLLQQQHQQQPLLLPPLILGQQQAGGVPPRLGLGTASSGGGTAAVPPVTEAGEPHPPTPSQGLWRPLSQNPLQLGLGQLQPLGAGAKGWIPTNGALAAEQGPDTSQHQAS